MQREFVQLFVSVLEPSHGPRIRVLRPPAPVLVGFPVGDDVEHTCRGYTGHPVAIDSRRRPLSRVEGWLRDAGFTIEASLVIGPDDDVPGAIVFARRGPDPTPTAG